MRILYTSALVGLTTILAIIWSAGFWFSGRDTPVGPSQKQDVDSAWRKTKPNTGEAFDQVQFLDGKNGWGRTSHVVWKTENGGQSWTQIRQSSEGKSLNNTTRKEMFGNLQFLSLTDGWILEGNDLLHTLDGGNSWQKSEFKNVIIRSFRFLDHDNGWAVGELLRKAYAGDAGDTWRGIVFITNDSGKTWREMPTGVSLNDNWGLRDVCPVSSKTIWLVGNVILLTNDGGLKWKEVNVKANTYGIPSYVRFIDSSIGWIRTNQGNKFLLTTDGGATWEVRSAPEETGGFTDLIYVNSDDAWGVAKGIYKSNDGGRTWVKSADETYYSLQYLSGQKLIVAAGEFVAKFNL